MTDNVVITNPTAPDTIADMVEGEFTASPYLKDSQIIDFMRWRKPMAIISLLVVLIGVVSIFTKGLNLGLDFTGGITTEVSYNQPVKTEQVVHSLTQAGFKDPVVQFVGSQRDIRVRMPPQDMTDLTHKITQAIALPNNTATVKKIDSVGSQVGSQLYKRAFIAIGLSLLLMFIYVSVRFEMKLATGAVISLVHDTLFTVGVFSIFGWPFDLAVLAAVLALIGYSLNDTIVVFDRIRENFKRIRGAAPAEIVNIALSETLRRTFMTVATVLLVVLAMYFTGGEGLHWFALALLVGLFAGTYSSIYIATSYALAMGLNRQDFMAKVRAVEDEEEEFFEE